MTTARVELVSRIDGIRTYRVTTKAGRVYEIRNRFRTNDWVVTNHRGQSVCLDGDTGRPLVQACIDYAHSADL